MSRNYTIPPSRPPDSPPRRSPRVFSGPTWLRSSLSFRYRARCAIIICLQKPGVLVPGFGVSVVDIIPASTFGSFFFLSYLFILFFCFLFQKTIESLTQRLHDVEKDRRSQKCQIQILQGNQPAIDAQVFQLLMDQCNNTSSAFVFLFTCDSYRPD